MSQSGPKVEVKYGPLGTFDPRQFSKAIQGLGLVFRWSRAVECPCRMDNTDTFTPTCSKCGGDGWWYISPDAATNRHQTTIDHIEVKCTFGQANMKPSMFESFGQFTFADAIMTFQNEMRVGYRDRFIGMEQEMSWTELLVSAGTGSTIVVGKSGRTTEVQKQALRYEPLLINFIADQDDAQYYHGTDFRILEGTKVEPRRLQFLDGRGPAAGKTYTVHYNCRPIWIVDDATYGIQGLRGPDKGLKGVKNPQTLPTTFKVKLDYLTKAMGS